MQPKYESNQAASMPQTNPNQESALQQLNEELAKAEESFETMRRSMPLVPNADYLGRMQAVGKHQRFHFQVHHFAFGTAHQRLRGGLLCNVLQYSHGERYHHQRG